MPSDYAGYFGAELQSLLHVLTHVGDVTQPKLKALMEASGIEIATGSINHILLRAGSWALDEQAAILKAGIAESPYTQTDTTQSKERGQRRVCHIVGGQYFEVFYTLKQKSLLAVLAALQGNPPDGILLRYDAHTQALLQRARISQKDQAKLENLFKEQPTMSLPHFEAFLEETAPEIVAKTNMYQRIRVAFALSHYHQQQDFPVVDWLLSDDAPEYKKIARLQQALCWVHDARDYNKLQPKVPHFQNLLAQFKEKYWKFYQKLLHFKDATKQEQKRLKEQLSKQFDTLFEQQTEFLQLDKLIETTYKNKHKLLAVLDNPALPLHNNQAELGARRIVRKRDISLHTWSKTGTQVRDAMMTIVQTAKKLDVSAASYIYDRVSRKYHMKPLHLDIIERYNQIDFD